MVENVNVVTASTEGFFDKLTVWSKVVRALHLWLTGEQNGPGWQIPVIPEFRDFCRLLIKQIVLWVLINTFCVMKRIRINLRKDTRDQNENQYFHYCRWWWTIHKLPYSATLFIIDADDVSKFTKTSMITVCLFVYLLFTQSSYHLWTVSIERQPCCKFWQLLLGSIDSNAL